MAKGHVKIKGNLDRVKAMSVNAIDENGNETDLGCYKFEIKGNVTDVVADVVLYCRHAEIDVEGSAKIKGDNKICQKIV